MAKNCEEYAKNYAQTAVDSKNNIPGNYEDLAEIQKTIVEQSINESNKISSGTLEVVNSVLNTGAHIKNILTVFENVMYGGGYLGAFSVQAIVGCI